MREGWSYKKLGEVCEVFDSMRKPVTKKDRKEGNYPYYGATGIQDYVDSYLFDGRYLLVGEDGAKWGANEGTAFIIEGKSWVNNHAHIIQLNKDVNDILVKYYLNFKDLSDYITGAVVPKLTQQALKNIQIPIPPHTTQQQIVSELDLLSHILDQKRQQLKEYDALAESIFYDMFGDPVDNPKGWEKKRLSEVCEYIVDGDHMPPPKSDTGIPFITISNVDKENKTIDFTSTYFVPNDYYNNLKEDHKPKVGDVLYTVTGSYGIPVLVKEERPFCFQRHIGLLHPNKDLNSCFLFGWAGSHDAKRQADEVATGIAQKTVSLKSLRQFEIPLPPLDLQRSFAAKIESIEHQKQLLRASIKETEMLFQSRMDYWFNG